MPLKGELVGRTISLVGVKDPAAPAAAPAAEAGHSGGHARAAGERQAHRRSRCSRTARSSGEMMTNMGPAKWTGEKLKAKKKS